MTYEGAHSLDTLRSNIGDSASSSNAVYSCWREAELRVAPSYRGLKSAFIRRKGGGPLMMVAHEYDLSAETGDRAGRRFPEESSAAALDRLLLAQALIPFSFIVRVIQETGATRLFSPCHPDPGMAEALKYLVPEAQIHAPFRRQVASQHELRATRFASPARPCTARFAADLAFVSLNRELTDFWGGNPDTIIKSAWDALRVGGDILIFIAHDGQRPRKRIKGQRIGKKATFDEGFVIRLRKPEAAAHSVPRPTRNAPPTSSFDDRAATTLESWLRPGRKHRTSTLIDALEEQGIEIDRLRKLERRRLKSRINHEVVRTALLGASLPILHGYDAAFRAAQYIPKRPTPHEIPKRKPGTFRTIFAYEPLDRLFLGALYHELEAILDPSFSEVCYGGRKGRSIGKLIREMQRVLAADDVVHTVIDVKACFDSISHDRLEALLVQEHPEHATPLMTILRGLGEVGLSPGSPIAPLLCNYFLDRLVDRLPAAKFMRRWIDDYILILPRKGADEVLTQLKAAIAAAGLEVSPKTPGLLKDGSIAALGLVVGPNSVDISKETQDDIDEFMKCSVELGNEQSYWKASAVLRYYFQVLDEESAASRLTHAAEILRGHPLHPVSAEGEMSFAPRRHAGRAASCSAPVAPVSCGQSGPLWLYAFKPLESCGDFGEIEANLEEELSPDRMGGGNLGDQDCSWVHRDDEELDTIEGNGVCCHGTERVQGDWEGRKDRGDGGMGRDDQGVATPSRSSPLSRSMTVDGRRKELNISRIGATPTDALRRDVKRPTPKERLPIDFSLELDAHLDLAPGQALAVSAESAHHSAHILHQLLQPWQFLKRRALGVTGRGRDELARIAFALPFAADRSPIFKDGEILRHERIAECDSGRHYFYTLEQERGQWEFPFLTDGSAFNFIRPKKAVLPHYAPVVDCVVFRTEPFGTGADNFHQLLRKIRAGSFHFVAVDLTVPGGCLDRDPAVLARDAARLLFKACARCERQRGWRPTLIVLCPPRGSWIDDSPAGVSDREFVEDHFDAWLHVERSTKVGGPRFSGAASRHSRGALVPEKIVHIYRLSSWRAGHLQIANAAYVVFLRDGKRHLKGVSEGEWDRAGRTLDLLGLRSSMPASLRALTLEERKLILLSAEVQGVARALLRGEALPVGMPLWLKVMTARVIPQASKTASLRSIQPAGMAAPSAAHHYAKGRANEKEEAKRFKAEEVPGSGSGRKGGDLQAPGIRIETKVTKENQFRLHGEGDLDKLARSTDLRKERPVFHVRLGNRDEIFLLGVTEIVGRTLASATLVLESHASITPFRTIGNPNLSWRHSTASEVEALRKSATLRVGRLCQ